MKNWKTTLAGLSSIIGGISLFVNDNSKLTESFTAVSIGIGLLFAKDFNVSGGNGINSIVGGNIPPSKDEK